VYVQCPPHSSKLIANLLLLPPDSYFFIPETKGLSLEEVDQMYSQHVKPWQSTSWTPSVRKTESWTDDKGEVHHVSRAKAPAVFH
jgi:hypothetical protein